MNERVKYTFEKLMIALENMEGLLEADFNAFEPWQKELKEFFEVYYDAKEVLRSLNTKELKP